MSDRQQDLERIAQEKYGKSYEQLDTSEKRSCAGTIGGETRKEQMTQEHGGDTHAAYSEMGTKGGQSTQGSS
jgi:hypothetical protein